MPHTRPTTAAPLKRDKKRAEQDFKPPPASRIVTRTRRAAALGSVLLLTALLSGCFGGSADAGLWSAEEAYRLALKQARGLDPQVELVGIEGIERAVNSTPIARPGGGTLGIDDHIGDGKVADWLVGFRAMAGVVLYHVDGNGTVSESDLDHPMLGSDLTLTLPPTTAAQAASIARSDAAFASLLGSANVTLSLSLQARDPAEGTAGAFWVLTAWDAERFLQAIVDATAGTLSTVRESLSERGGTLVHHHAAMALFVDAQRISFDHADFDRTRNPGKAFFDHADTPGGGVIHVEGSFLEPDATVTLGTFLETMGFTFHPSFVQLPSKGGLDGSVYATDENMTWRYYVAERGESFQSVHLDDPLVLQDGRRILVTYGPVEGIPEPELARQMAAVPPASA